jgi:RNA polymerase sigma-70 factor, ECF subfamily
LNDGGSSYLTGPDRVDTAELRTALEENRKKFLAAVEHIRPRLHRFCTRMCGSVFDGEDVVQETLAQAFYSLSTLRDISRLEPWLFRIAHNKCVDFIRRTKGSREETMSYDEGSGNEFTPEERELPAEPVDHALAALVSELPPLERACVLLKDVLDYRLAEIAEVVDSTTGGVKSALHRGRAKLRQPHLPRQPAELDPQQRELLNAYIECFNRRDWDGLSRLIQADARVELVGVTEGAPADLGYFRNYAALPYEWRLDLALVDDQPTIVHWQKRGVDWVPLAAIRLWWRDGKVSRIRDYVHVEYLLRYSRTEPGPVSY